MDEDDGDALATVEWWLSSTTFGEMSGQPVGPPEWPLPGGLLNQPAKLVEAVGLLRAEWAHVVDGRAKAVATSRTERR